jgi:hypothetical protein
MRASLLLLVDCAAYWHPSDKSQQRLSGWVNEQTSSACDCRMLKMNTLWSSHRPFKVPLDAANAVATRCAVQIAELMYDKCKK